MTGGQAAAHGPVHLDVDPLSASNRYTVSLSLPKARMVPSFPECFVVITTAAGFAVAASAGAPVELWLGDAVGVALAVADEVELLLLPHAVRPARPPVTARKLITVRLIAPPRI